MRHGSAPNRRAGPVTGRALSFQGRSISIDQLVNLAQFFVVLGGGRMKRLLALLAGSFFAAAAGAHPIDIPGFDERIAEACAAASPAARDAVEESRRPETRATAVSLARLSRRTETTPAGRVCLAAREYEMRLAASPGSITDAAIADTVRRLARAVETFEGRGEGAPVARAYLEAVRASLQDFSRGRLAYGRVQTLFGEFGLTDEAAFIGESAYELEHLALSRRMHDRANLGTLYNSLWRLTRYIEQVWERRGREPARSAYVELLGLQLRSAADAQWEGSDLVTLFAEFATFLDYGGEAEPASRVRALLSGLPRLGPAGACRTFRQGVPEWFGSLECPPDGGILAELELASADAAAQAVLRQYSAARLDLVQGGVAGQPPADLLVTAGEAEAQASATVDPAEARALRRRALAFRQAQAQRDPLAEARLLCAIAQSHAPEESAIAIAWHEEAVARFAAGQGLGSPEYLRCAVALLDRYLASDNAFLRAAAAEVPDRMGIFGSAATRLATLAFAGQWGAAADDRAARDFMRRLVADQLEVNLGGWAGRANHPAEYRIRLAICAALTATRAVTATFPQTLGRPVEADFAAVTALLAHHCFDQEEVDRQIARLALWNAGTAIDYPFDARRVAAEWIEGVADLRRKREESDRLTREFEAWVNGRGRARASLVTDHLIALRQARRMREVANLEIMRMLPSDPRPGEDPAEAFARWDQGRPLAMLTSPCHDSAIPVILEPEFDCRVAEYAISLAALDPRIIALRGGFATVRHGERLYEQMRREVDFELQTYLSATLALLAAGTTGGEDVAYGTLDVIQRARTLTVPADTASEALGRRAAATLGDDEAVIGFVVLADQVVAWVLRRSNFIIMQLQARPMLLRHLNTQLRASLNPAGAASVGSLEFDAAAAHNLYLALIAPLEPSLQGVSNLFVVPEGPLHGVPFAALLREAPPGAAWTIRSSWRPSWLVDRYAIANIPSLAWFLERRTAADSPAQSARPFIGFGLSAGRPGAVPLPPLPHVTGELTQLAGLLGGDSDSIRMEFQEADVTDAALAGRRVVAFATHGLGGTEDHEPALVTAPGEGGDGLLTASELRRMHFDADLVILSACNTGTDGARDEQRGQSRLIESLIAAGARAVMATHWPLVSETAGRMTVPVATRRSSSAAALQAAMRDLIGRGGEQSHPAVWASFFVVAADRAR